MGRNGAGKTTAMRITLGLARADAGEVRWKGRPVSAEDRRAFKVRQALRAQETSEVRA